MGHRRPLGRPQVGHRRPLGLPQVGHRRPLGLPTTTPPASEAEDERSLRPTSSRQRPLMTSGSANIGVTAEEADMIRAATLKHQLKPDVDELLKSAPENNLGKTPHRVSLKYRDSYRTKRSARRLARSSCKSSRLGGQSCSPRAWHPQAPPVGLDMENGAGLGLAAGIIWSRSWATPCSTESRG